MKICLLCVLRLLCREFRSIINGKGQVNDLEKWILKTKKSPNKALRNFAYGIAKEKEAIQAAIDIPLSNGRAEGTVNKIKAGAADPHHVATCTRL